MAFSCLNATPRLDLTGVLQKSPCLRDFSCWLFNAGLAFETTTKMFLSKVSVLFTAAFCLVSLSASMANEVQEWDDVDEKCVWTGPTCIDDCCNRQDGLYQSCRSRKIYVRCTSGSTYYKNCPRGLIWDDNRKQCNKTSTAICFCYPERETCKTTGRRCISNCCGLPDGDYQSCRGCAIYASCVGGQIIDYRPCALNTPGSPPLQWNDITKQCNYTSPTCQYCYKDNQRVPQRLSWSSILKK